MGRPREFDEAAVLDHAVDAFWRHGYAATSIRDLATSTGVATSALYRTWGDKHQLFLRVLDRYAERQAQTLATHIDVSTPMIPALAGWIRSRVAEAGSAGHNGCLFVNTAAELGSSDVAAASRAIAAWRRLTEMLASALRHAQGTGEIDGDLDVEMTSALILTTVLGLRVRSRAGDDAGALATAIDGLLATLGGN